MIFYEPVNLKQWDMFEKVHGPGHVEPFLATKSMSIGDTVLLHVGSQDKTVESGVYAYGTVVEGPLILKDHPEDYCNNKNTVLVKITHIVKGRPLLTHDQCKEFITQFRTVHCIDPVHYKAILEALD